MSCTELRLCKQHEIEQTGSGNIELILCRTEFDIGHIAFNMLRFAHRYCPRHLILRIVCYFECLPVVNRTLCVRVCLYVMLLLLMRFVVPEYPISSMDWMSIAGFYVNT